MRYPLRALAPAVLLAGGLLVVPATPASALPPECDITTIWQNTYVPGEDYGRPFTPRCWLDVGSHGSAVSTLQSGLNTCYHKGLAVDGDYGPRTRTAVRELQQALGISDDGVYGPQTAGAIAHVVVNGGGACRHIML